MEGKARAIAHFTNGLGNFILMMPALQAMAFLADDKKVDICIDDGWTDYRRSAVEEICRAWPTTGRIVRYPKDNPNPDDYGYWFCSAHGMSNDVARVFLPKMRRIVPKPNWRASQMHEADHYMDIARAAGYVGGTPRVEFPMADGPILDLPRPLIGLCNGYFRTSIHYWDCKGWPHFGRLSEALHLYFGASVIGLGSKDEIPSGVRLDADYTGRLSILETARAMSQLDLLITTDTGLMHLGNLLETPLIAMFGPTLTSKNAPRAPSSHVLRSGLKCAPCQDTERFYTKCDKNRCMEGITVGDVMAKAREVLNV